MRIIAGRLKGRRLIGPTGAGVRPTADGLRERLFNVLGASVEGARVLDAFAGTGALGLEALSRGASHATFVEREPAVLRGLHENIARCGAEPTSRVVRGDFLALQGPPPGEAGARRRADRPAVDGPFDLILLDPPYDVSDLSAVVAAAAPLAVAGGTCVLEHSSRRASPEAAASLRRSRVLTAGDSALSFYALAPE